MGHAKQMMDLMDERQKNVTEILIKTGYAERCEIHGDQVLWTAQSSDPHEIAVELAEDLAGLGEPEELVATVEAVMQDAPLRCERAPHL